MSKRDPLANLPRVPPGEKWTAQDGREYTVHRNGRTLIDKRGRYFSAIDLRPLPKLEIDRAHRYAVFEGEEAEILLDVIS